MKNNWINKVHVEGYVFNFGNNDFRKLQKKVAGENAKNPGQEYIQGDINIATNEDATNIVTVHFQYVTPTWPAKNGKPERPNTTYQTLETLLNNGSTYEEVGTNAVKVRIDGNVGVEDFYDKTGELQSPKRIDGSFIHIMNGGETIADRASTFEIEMVIAGAEEREVENGEDYVQLRGYAFNFRNDALPIILTVRDKNGMNYFVDQDISNANPMVTKVWGDIVSNIIKIEKTTESAFGAPTVDVTTRTVRAWDVIGASAEPMDWDDDSTITKAELKKCLEDRETRLAEMKKRQEEYQSNKNNTTSAFTTSKNTSAEDDDDFAF